MLVVLGPPFEGSDVDYSRLAQTTGLVAYDLRTKLKPGYWGVVRALADPEQAQDLVQRLAAFGYRVAAIEPAVGHDPERRVVPIRGLELGPDHVVIQLRERSMAVPYAGIATIVRGEVQIGGAPRSMARGPTPSSATFRAVVPSAADMALFRETLGSGHQLDAYGAADIHFFTVPWIARIDARSFDFSVLEGPSEGAARDLDRLVDLLAERSGARVDRGSRVSSLLSFTGATGGVNRHSTPPPGAPRSVKEPGTSDDRFDAYSRMIAEAERLTRVAGQIAPR